MLKHFATFSLVFLSFWGVKSKDKKKKKNPRRTPKILGKEGKNTQKNKEFLARKKKSKEFQKSKERKSNILRQLTHFLPSPFCGAPFVQGEIIYAPPPLPPFLAKRHFPGEGGGGVYSGAPRGRNLYTPLFYTPPTLRRVFSPGVLRSKNFSSPFS